MNDLFRTMTPNRSVTKEDNEVALTVTTGGKFKGFCRNCKKTGHKAKDCRFKKNGNTNTINLRPCKHCGGKHMDHKCWELPENATNRPRNWVSKKGNETSNIGCDIDTSPVMELLLSNIDDEPHTFSHQQDMLLQPSIWIGDTGATVHMTPHSEGMIRLKNTKGGITVGNGEVLVAKKTGDIPSEICDKYGNVVTTGIVTDVALTKGSPFNLFSLTKAMQQGWILGGDNTSRITLTKGTNVLKFDIPIVTPKGVVYAMYMRRTEVAASSVSTTMKIEKAHRLLGHQSEDTTRQTTAKFWR
jgi:hypothetical protein